MKLREACLILMLFLIGSSRLMGATAACSLHLDKGDWSNSAVDISPSGPGGTQNLRVCSPDNKKAVVVKDEHWWVEIGHDAVSKPASLDFHVELQWAPGSGAFYLTGSDGETTGSHTEIYELRARHLVSVHTGQAVVNDFEKHHKCWDRRFGVGNDPNVAGLTWTDSGNLLLVAEVPNLGICDQMKYFGGYVISIRSGRITARYSPNQLVDRWADVIGDRLRSDLHYLSAEQQRTLP
jgi:hypothetical protein